MKRWLWFLFIGLCVVISISVTHSPAQAQGNSLWTVQYYNNSNLSGTPITASSVAGINFNWGSGAPINGVGVDNWTARFSTIANFGQGTYRFSIYADDSVRLYVHGQLLIDSWNNPKPGQTLTADMVLTAGDGGVQVDYREVAGNAYVTVTWSPISVVVTNPPPASYGVWTAQYYNNRNLSNNPSAIQGEASPSHDWGNNAPIAGVGVDMWSARWTSSQNLTGGIYRLTVTVDDGARVYIDGGLLLNEWHGSPTIATYTRDIQLAGGLHTIVIEYYDDTGIARLNYSLAPVSGSGTAPVPSGSPSLTVNTANLNVRSAPYIGDNILTRIQRGQTYAITGRTNNSDWFQIQIGQSVGWVSAYYVVASNTGGVPVVTTQVSAPNAPATSTGYSLRSTVFLNIRSGAGTGYSRLGILPYNATATILARNANNSWWLISYNGVTGWVSGAYVVLLSGIDYNRIPVR